MRSNLETDVQAQPTFIEAARRAQLIQCAIDTIAELGYSGASLAEIAKRARISKSVISYYFTSKDDLIRQVIDHVFAAGAEFMIPRVHAQTTPRAALHAYITSNVAFMAANRKHMVALFNIATGFRDKDGTQRFVRSELDPAVNELEELLRLGQDGGDFRAFDTRVMAYAIRATIDDIPARLASGLEADIDAFGSELAELFDRATRKQPAPRKGAER
jgi:AcrR family transcriptional regulator